MKNGVLILVTVLTITQCSNKIHEIVSLKNPSLKKYYNREIEKGINNNAQKIRAVANYNSLVSSILNDYTIPFAYFSIEQDSLSIYYDGKLIKSLNDKNSPFQISFSQGHILSSLQCKYFKTKTKKVVIMAETSRINVDKNKIQVYDLDEKSRVGKYYEFEGKSKLLTKGFYQLLDSVRIDTNYVMDNNTYNELFILKNTMRPGINLDPGNIIIGKVNY